jgi:hypothetical protein
MSRVTYESVYGYNPENNTPGAFVDEEDDCYIEDYSDYRGYFALTNTPKYETVGFHCGSWESPIMPYRHDEAWTSVDEEKDDDWGEFHSFPLSSEDKLAYEIACQEGLSYLPVSFSCKEVKQLKLEELKVCPCFLLSLQPDPGSEAYATLSECAERGSGHKCELCTWCNNCTTIHPDYFCILAGFTFTAPVSGGSLPWFHRLPPGFKPKIRSASLNILPLEDGQLPPAKAVASVVFERTGPDKPICGISPRLLNVRCHRHCHSPYDIYKRRSSFSCFRDESLRSSWNRNWTTDKPFIEAPTNQTLALVNTFLLAVIVLLVALHNGNPTELVVRCVPPDK